MPFNRMLHKSFRLIASICAFSVGVSQPVSAFALRPHVDRSGLEEKLTTGLEENVTRVREALDERAWNQLKHFSSRMKEWDISWTTPVQIAGVWADVDWTLTRPDRFENRVPPSLARSLAWVLNHQGRVGAITGSPYRAADLLDPKFHFPASVDRRLVGVIREQLISPHDIQRLRVLARSGGYDVHFSPEGEEEIRTSPVRFRLPEQLEISRRMAIAALHAIQRTRTTDLSKEINRLEQASDIPAIAEILRDVEKTNDLLRFPGIAPLEVDDTMIFVTFRDHALDPAEILAEARSAIGPTTGIGLPIDFIQGPMYVAVSLLRKSETLARSMHEEGTKTGLFIVAGDGPKDDLPMLIQAANSRWLVLPLFVGDPAQVGTLDPVVVPRERRFVEATDHFLTQAVAAANAHRPYADLPLIAGEITPRQLAQALGVPLSGFSAKIQEMSYSDAAALLVRTGLEESVFPPPEKITDSLPATQVWEGAGSDVLPADDERLARMAFESPRGGPQQYLRIFGSLEFRLPQELRTEQFGGKALLSYLPDGATLNSGYIDAIDEPFVRARVRDLLTDPKKSPQVRARIRLAGEDIAIPLQPINVWPDGKVRYEGRVPAEDPRFHVDRPFTVEVYWQGKWYRLSDEGRIRIEPPNPAQVAAKPGPDELAIGMHDAQQELRYARGLLPEVPDDEDRAARQALLDAGIVTNQNLPPAQRAPYLRQLERETAGFSPAQSRRAFLAQQRAAGVQQDSFFVGMQFKLGVLPSGDRVLVMYNPNRANTPKPMPGAAHPLSEDKPVQFKAPSGEVITLKQRMLPVPSTRLANPLKDKANPYGYVWGHSTLPVSQQTAQADWTEAIDAVVEQMWQQRERLTVIGVNLGPKAAASLPDWAHAHDIPWRMPVDEVGDSEILWLSEENGVRMGLLRDPFMTTYVFEGDEQATTAMIAQAKQKAAELKKEGLGEFNGWGVVRPDGIGRLFILPRNPVEPAPPADAAKWKPTDDYAKPIADQDYWIVSLSLQQHQLMSREEMERSGLKPAGDPLVFKGRPVIDIKMGIMELRRFVLVAQLGVYEDPYLEARLVKAYQLVGVPWSDPRIHQDIRKDAAGPAHLADEAVRQVRQLTQGVAGISSAGRLVELFDAVSEWRHRQVDAFSQLSGEGDERTTFTSSAERLIEQWAGHSPLIREVPSLQQAVPPPDPAVPPVVAVALNPTLDRGVRVNASNGQDTLEVSESAGGAGANLAQASSVLGREAHLIGLFSGETGQRAQHSLGRYGVHVQRLEPREPQPDTRPSLMVASSRPGRRERRLVSRGSATPAGLVGQIRSAPESETWNRRPHLLMVGERWVGETAPAVAREIADLIRSTREAGNDAHVTANPSWAPGIWETLLASQPTSFSSTLEGLTEYLGRQTEVDVWRHRPGDVAQAADALRRKFGIREWLVHLGAAGTVLVTDAGWWHVVPSPVLQLTYLSGATDVVDATYLLQRVRNQSPADALKAGITASLLFMESHGVVPSREQVQSRLFRAQVNILPRPVSAQSGLEERTTRMLETLAEAKTGRGIVVVPAQALERFTGLEEFLVRLSASDSLSRSFVLWGEGEAVTRLEKQNPYLRRFQSQDLTAFSVYLAGLEEAESIGILGAAGLVRPLAALLSSRGIPVRVIGWNLLEVLSTIGLPKDVLTQVGLEELQSDLFRVRGT